jgi:hypothetical protein
MEGILALLIPVIALSTGFVAVLKRSVRHPRVGPSPDTLALADEVAQLRLELADMRDKVEFTERLLAGGNASQRLSSPAMAGMAPGALTF